MGPLIPLFWTSGDVSSGFQSQNGQPYSSLAEAYVSIMLTVCFLPISMHIFTSTVRNARQNNTVV